MRPDHPVAQIQIVHRLFDQIPARLSYIEVPVVRCTLMRNIVLGMALRLNHDDVADNSLANLRDYLLVLLHRAQLLAGDENLLGAPGRFHHGAYLRGSHSDRLFAIHVFADLQRRHSHLRVEVRRRRNEYSVNVLVFDHLSPIGIGLWIVSGGSGGRFVEPVGFDIAQSQNFRVGLLENAIQQMRTAIADPNHAGSNGLRRLRRSGGGGRT